MAEYSSLYIKLHIKKEKLDEFFLSKLRGNPVSEDWLAWWDSRAMYSKEALDFIPHYENQNSRAVFESLLQNKNFAAKEGYNDDEHSWKFVSVFYSENYIEILPMLSLLKELATYQEVGETGVAILYDFYWDCSSVMAYMDFGNQKALLRTYTSPTQIKPAILEEANTTLEETIEQLMDQSDEND